MRTGTMLPDPANPEAFQCIEAGNVDDLKKFTADDLRPFLSILVRSSLIQAGDLQCRPVEFRQKILVSLSDIEPVNNIVALLSVDFQTLEVDVKKELQLRQKLGNREQDSVLVQSLQHALAIDYERSDATRRLRLVLSELLLIISQMHEPRQEYYMKSSDLFDHFVYVEDVCDTISIALVELPNLLSICDVCEAMLHVQHGPWIICRLVANMPDAFTEVCLHLISNGEKCEEETEGGLVRLEALKLLCKMNPRNSLLIRSRCVELCRMPALSILLSLDADVENNLIPFLSGVLLGNDQQVRNWFSYYVRNGQKRKIESTSSLMHMRTAVWTYLKTLVNRTTKVIKASHAVQASSLLRLICALKGIAAFKFTDEEVDDLVNLVTLKAPDYGPGHRFVTLGICTLLACPSMVSLLEHEKIIIEWIRSLIREDSHTSGKGNSSYGEILLLMAIHFHSNQLNAISDLVCTTLGMKIPIRINTMTRIKQIFTQEIFTEQVITQHAVRVPVTTNLKSSIAGFLPVHCVYQLIKSRACMKHRVPIKEWVYRQILASEQPIHPVMPALMEVYVQSILTTTTGFGGITPKTADINNEPFTDEEILKVFQSINSENLAAPLLVLYYVLLYEDYRLINLKTLILSGKKFKSYSGKIFSQIPVKFLLQEAQKGQHKCGGLFPPLLKLLTTHFPQLCLVNEWLGEISSANLECRDPLVVLGSKHYFDSDEPTKEEINQAFEICPNFSAKLVGILEACKRLPPHVLWSHANEIVFNIKVVLGPTVPRKVHDLYKDVWFLLNNVYPRHLWEMTTNALLDETTYLIADDLILDPVQILRCDPRVFRCAPILSILLHMLSASMSASKYFYNKHLLENHPHAVTPGCIAPEIERDELKTALIALQESAIIQILLECCLIQKNEKSTMENDLCRQEVQQLICIFLHQLFMADVHSAKLIHFQSYPMELLPVTVRGIPSLHICLDFIPELLAQPELEKQCFAIVMMSHLAVQCSLPKSYGIAKHAIATMLSMASGIVSPERAEFFSAAIPSLCRVSVAFPPLVDDIIALLFQVAKISNAQNSIERNRMSQVVRNKKLFFISQETFMKIVQQLVLNRKVCY
ncbi:unnamed protein product [Allacma fusca]|uniref:Integrator complex subunit 2 n=1 Tax=Allacma fusca TaxID=39272 RepID=A0A8J2JHZ6_9HEXA|nr:unnamed protein product [Allacma fusca]